MGLAEAQYTQNSDPMISKHSINPLLAVQSCRNKIFFFLVQKIETSAENSDNLTYHPVFRFLAICGRNAACGAFVPALQSCLIITSRTVVQSDVHCAAAKSRTDECACPE